MNYLFAPESVAERQTILQELGEAIGPDSPLEMFQDIAEFAATLRRLNNPEIIVMLDIGKDGMPNILSLFDLFRNAAIIIMLSDEENETITSAIRMRPKFIGATDGDLGKIVPVVKKLIRTKNARELKYSTDHKK